MMIAPLLEALTHSSAVMGAAGFVLLLAIWFGVPMLLAKPAPPKADDDYEDTGAWK